MWGVENDIRTSSKNNTHTYQIALFASCREIFDTKKHCGLFGGTESQAYLHFDAAEYTELLAQIAKNKELKFGTLEKLNQALIEKVRQLESAEAERLQQSGKFVTIIHLMSMSYARETSQLRNSFAYTNNFRCYRLHLRPVRQAR